HLTVISKRPTSFEPRTGRRSSLTLGSQEAGLRGTTHTCPLGWWARWGMRPPMVLLELMTGRLALDKSRPKEEQSLAEWVALFLASPSKLYRVMDPALSGRYSVKGALTAAAVARDCLTRKAKQWPRMSEVVTTLHPVLELFNMAGFDSSGVGVGGGLGGGAGGKEGD
ncbi:unnamed protein product, partial [Closterium sp. Yama58-4]